MEDVNTAVAVFEDHNTAETAVKKLAEAGLEIKNLSIVGQGYHTDEKVTGFYNAGDRIKFWGTRGAFWGGFWGLLLGGVFMMTPIGGSVVVLGYLGAIVIAGLENAILVGGISAIAAALYSIGIPKNSVLEYEAALKADKFLVMAHGTSEEVARAKSILSTVSPSSLDVHKGVTAVAPIDRLAHASA
ncbi:MAG: general stress protein [Rhodomicrobium sp.]